MTQTTTTWTVLPAPVPASPDDDDAWALLGSNAVSLACDLVLYGHDDLSYTIAESLAHLRNQQHAIRTLLVAVPAGSTGRADDVVGSASVSMLRESNQHVAFLGLHVHPDRRGQGVGAALLDAAERLAAEHGRTTVITDTAHMGEPEASAAGVLEPPTGSGRIDGADSSARFALDHGYRLEQAERYSVLEVPVDTSLLERLHADAAAKAGDDYRLVSWTERTPEQWVDQLALLNTRMSTDVPTGALEMGEDPWDAERVRTAERDIADGGNGYLIVAAEHIPTGTLAAYTMVKYPRDKPAVLYQEDTLVLREHRGRRLGMLIKTEALRLVRDLRPQASRIHTWNAEENHHMLSINVALGFRPVGVEGMWQKHLD